MKYPEQLFFSLKLPDRAKEYAIKAIESGYCGRIGEFVDKATLLIKERFNREVLLTANGTVSLELALRTLDIGCGDIVLVQNVSFVATANAVNSVGAKILFIDNIKDELHPSPESIEYFLNHKEYFSRIKALIVAPLYGICSPYIDLYKQLCDKYNISLIEDAAQSFGSKYDDKLIGTFGDIASYSFFSNKTLASGQGGALVLKNKAIADKALLISKHGQFDGNYVGYGSNLGFNNLSASLLYANLLSFDSYITKRKKLHNIYKELINQHNIPIDILDSGSDHIAWVLPIKRREKNINRKKFIELIKLENVAIREGMSYLPNFSHIKKINSNSGDSFNGERPDEVLLPIHHGMDEESILRVTTALKKTLKK